MFYVYIASGVRLFLSKEGILWVSRTVFHSRGVERGLRVVWEADRLRMFDKERTGAFCTIIAGLFRSIRADWLVMSQSSSVSDKFWSSVNEYKLAERLPCIEMSGSLPITSSSEWLICSSVKDDGDADQLCIVFNRDLSIGSWMPEYGVLGQDRVKVIDGPSQGVYWL